MADPDSTQKSILQTLFEKLFIPVLVAVLAAVIIAYLNPNPQREITIKNSLALSVKVQVNNKPEYGRLILPGESVTIKLLNDKDFPAQVYWTVVRYKNNLGMPIGEELKNYGAGDSGDNGVVELEKGETYELDNAIGSTIYFYPIIENSTNEQCKIIINDGLTIREEIGFSSPQTTANKTGYYKYASNSNVTLECPSNTYFRGQRNGVSGPPLEMEASTGKVHIPIP